MKKLILLSFLLLQGCGSKVLGIYDSDYTCPQNEQGECVSVEEAHRGALGKDKPKGADSLIVTDYKPDALEEEEFLVKDVSDFRGVMLEYEKCLKKKSAGECGEIREKLMSRYRSAEDRGRAKELHGVSMQERVAKLAVMEAVVGGGSNTVPVRQPDTVMELHIMPYRTGFGALASERVIWVVVQEGEWTWATSEGKAGARAKLGATR